MGRRISLLFGLLILFNTTIFAQNAQLAQSFFQNKEYEKALEEYTLLYKKVSTEQYYEPLVNCYLQLKAYQEGQKFCKKHLKISFSPLLVKIDLAQFYALNQDPKAATATNESIISELGPYTEQVLAVGKKFLQIKNYTYAVATYEKGRKLLKNEYPFSLELAEVYGALGDYPKMVGEILFVLTFGDYYLESVKNTILTQLSGDQNGKIAKLFKDELTAIIQKHPKDLVFMELLIWMYLEEQNYSGAFVYTKALEKQLDEGGRKMMELAQLARKGGAFEVAQKAYLYVIETYPNTYYYQMSRLQLVEVLKEKIDQSPVKAEADLLALEQAYKQTLQELGKTAQSVNLLRAYGEVLAFYRNKPLEAINLLDETLLIPRISASDAALCKILLADIYVFQDNVWEATLLYGQVANDFKNDPVGHQAKLKNAKAYFYTGNFEWAKTQLDVLKTATSKLIANDALQLSVLISDNLGVDTSTVPLSLLAKADLWAFQKNYDSALFQLNQLILSFPEHPSILDEAHFRKGEIYSQLGLWNQAIENYQKAVDLNDLLVDDALIQMAKIYEQVLLDQTKAMACYERILLEFEASVYAAEARNRFRALQTEGSIKP